MNIALVTETFPPEVNGVAMTLQRLAVGVAERGDEITVVRPRQAADRAAAAVRIAADPGAAVSGNGRSHALAGPVEAGEARLYSEWLVPGVALPRYEGLMMGLPVLGRLRRRWERHRPDVVHIATEGPLGWSALGAAAKLGLPISSSFHTNFHQYGTHYGYGAIAHIAVGYLRSFHNGTAITMVPTRQMRATLESQGFRNVAVVSRGVDTELFSPARRSDDLRRSWGAGPHDPVVLYVGRLAKEKNIGVAVDSFLALREREPAARFVLVGDGPERAGLQARFPEFHFAGMRRGEDLGAHYASGDVFLFPSITETFGNVVTEALASGLVVVTYDYAAGREHIRSGANGVLARFDDPASFRSTALDVLASRAAWPRLRAGARETALNVTWDEIIGRFRETLARVAATSRAGSAV